MASNNKATLHSRARSVAFCGLCIALITVSAWISIPIGPVPVTLQIFAVAFVALVLRPKEALATIVIYLAIGAVGLPVFSAMRSGIGILAGPTGGFLWGYIIGIAAALAIRYLFRTPVRTQETSRDNQRIFVRQTAGDTLAALAFLVVSYVCGWLQFILVMGVDPVAAFLTAIAPFIVIDVLKLVAAIITAGALRQALPSLRI